MNFTNANQFEFQPSIISVVQGLTTTATKTAALFCTPNNGESSVYEVWCEAVDALGGRALGKKQIDITRSQTTAGGAWTTAVGITVDVATKRTSGIVNGVDFSAELAPDSIGVQFTVTGAASKSLFWKLSIIEGVSATHPDNLVAGLRTS